MLPVTATSRDHAICSYYYFCYHNSNNCNCNFKNNYYYYDYYYYDYCCKNINRIKNNNSYSNEDLSQ